MNLIAEYVNKAVAADNCGDYREAIDNYGHAVEYFNVHLKYDKNPQSVKAIKAKCVEYLNRAEALKDALQGQQQGDGGSGAAGSAAATATGARTKGKEEEMDALKASLGDAILQERPNVRWDDVAGLDGAKDALKEAVILPVKFPQFFTGKRKPWSGILLFGPPGTGKSYLAKAVATEAESTFFSVSSSDLVSKWMGESEKLVNSLFKLAREKAPSIIFIDEIDALCSTRGEGESEAARRIKTEFLVQMQGVNHSNDDRRVLLLGATNLPYALDQAVRRRFDKRIYIPLPDATARAAMFKIHLGETPHNISQSQFDELAAGTQGFSGSDIAVLVKDVLMQPIRKTQDATHFKPIKTPQGHAMLEPCSPSDPLAFPATLNSLANEGRAADVRPPDITLRDFQKVLLRARPTVSTKDLETYVSFTKEFGEEG